MQDKLLEKWNQSHQRIPKDKSVSQYAIEKERLFLRNSVVLDLGGGTGSDAIYFAQKGHTVIVCDISDFALTQVTEKAELLGLDVRTVQSNLMDGEIHFEDGFFNIVYSRLALHYFDSKTTVKLFKEINRILRVGGIAFLTIKSPADVEEMKFLRANAKVIEDNIFMENGDIKSRFTVDQLKNMLKEAGIADYTVTEYIEDLSNRVDTVKSGNLHLLLNEIILKRS